MTPPVDELVLDEGPDGADDAPPPDRDGAPGRRSRRRRFAALAGAAALVVFAAWSGHAAGVTQGRGAGAREALAQARVLVWFTGEGAPDGAGRARFELFAASGSGRPVTLRVVHAGADTITPVRPLLVPAGTSASTTAVVEAECGSARGLELMRAAPGSGRVGSLTAEVADADGSVREVPAALLPDDTSFRTLVHLAACPRAGGAVVPGLAITAMSARTNGDLVLTLDAGPDASPATVRVVSDGPDGTFSVTASPASVSLRPGDRRTVTVRVGVGRCPGVFGGLPSVAGLFALEVSTPGLVSRARLPGWDDGAVGQAAAIAAAQRCD